MSQFLAVRVDLDDLVVQEVRVFKSDEERFAHLRRVYLDTEPGNRVHGRRQSLLFDYSGYRVAVLAIDVPAREE